MSFAARWLLIPVVLIGLTGSAQAVGPGVRDEAKFFSADAVARANELTRELNRQYRTELVIETVARVPEDLQARYKKVSENKEERNKFFRDWAAQRARNEGDKGIYILICKDPPHLEALVDRTTRQRTFTEEDRNRLVAR